MGSASTKMYDNMGPMIRVEYTTYEVLFFKLHRIENKRDGSRQCQLAPLEELWSKVVRGAERGSSSGYRVRV